MSENARMGSQPSIGRVVAGVCLAAAGPALAQCPPERLLSPSDHADAFGAALAMNDRHLIIGDPHDGSLCTIPGCSNGWAYAYRRNPAGGWDLTQSVLPASLDEGWAHGFAVALDGDRAIITAALSPEGPGTGVPYVFEFDGDQWVQVDALMPPDSRALHGGRLALRGDTALVGMADAKVLVYRNTGGVWEVTHDLENPDSTGVRTDFGWAIDLSDDWLVIGAPEEELIAVNGGAVYVYRRLTGGELELAQKLIAPDVMIGPRFGRSVAVDGDTLAVGGVLSHRTYQWQGAVYVYSLVDGQWQLHQELTHQRPAARDQLGIALALDGDLLAAGAAGDITPVSRGAAYLFRRYGDDRWRQAAELFPTEPAVGDGGPVAIADGIVAVGAHDTWMAGRSAGAVDIFDLDCLLCDPDLDGDGDLTFFDFLAFGNLFSAGDLRADFDDSGALDLFDFLAFQTAFDAGC
ncbi:MAG: GC-type dockerin domain-anchored protein [Phycisphaerales bacterium JB039]